MPVAKWEPPPELLDEVVDWERSCRRGRCRDERAARGRAVLLNCLAGIMATSCVVVGVGIGGRERWERECVPANESCAPKNARRVAEGKMKAL